jgi:hypothetical protein
MRRHHLLITAGLVAVAFFATSSPSYAARGGGLHLPLEPAEQFGVAGAFGADDLDRAGALEQAVLGQVNLAHAAAQAALEPVLGFATELGW